MAANQEWHYVQNGQQYGPVSSAELKQLAFTGQLSATDLIWKEGWTEWKAAATIKGLFTQPPVIPATPVFEPPVPAQSPPKKSKSNYTWLKLGAGGFVLMSLILGAINGPRERKNGQNKPVAEAKQVEVKPAADGAGNDAFLTTEFLYSEYQGNAVAAARKYTSKSLTVLGKVHSVKSFSLVGVTIFMAGERHPGILLGCLLNGRTANSKELDSLRPGDYVKVTGTCTGADIAGTVTMENCKFTVAASGDRF